MVHQSSVGGFFHVADLGAEIRRCSGRLVEIRGKIDLHAARRFLGENGFCLAGHPGQGILDRFIAVLKNRGGVFRRELKDAFGEPGEVLPDILRYGLRLVPAGCDRMAPSGIRLKTNSMKTSAQLIHLLLCSDRDGSASYLGLEP
jgi:hypothetical protein